MRGLIIDLFAGGGGASVGIEMALGRQADIAVNHDPKAILMYRTNHPNTVCLTEDVFKVNLKKYVKGRHVAFMWASPDCTHHSKAKGGKPKEKGLRALPWAVYRHAKDILPDVIMMENVEEIKKWGPLCQDGYPIKEKEGEDYKKFIKAMQGLGYDFDSRELVAADYGAPTTRKRWYAIFRRDGRPIVWPEPTHNKKGSDGLEKWEPIWKYLDLADFGKSIFGRKKPLAENTMNRIARGLDKFVFNSPEPFIMKYYGGGYTGAGSSIHEPLHTITTVDHNALVTPMMIQYHSETSKKEVRGQDVRNPVMTIDTSNRYGLVMQFLTKFYKTGTGQSVREPIHTITTSPGHFGQISVYAIPKEELLANIDKADVESSEIVQQCTWVSQFIMEYYGASVGQNLKEPLHTIVSKDRFALITVLGNEYAILDIYLRMLKAEPELKLGQGFPEDYVITKDYLGNKYPIKEQVARIGNSVVPVMAQRLTEMNCSHLRIGKRLPICRMDMARECEGGQLKFA